MVIIGAILSCPVRTKRVCALALPRARSICRVQLHNLTPKHAGDHVAGRDSEVSEGCSGCGLDLAGLGSQSARALVQVSEARFRAQVKEEAAQSEVAHQHYPTHPPRSCTVEP